ncbi:MAG: hypothetical protein H8K10_10670 [Nitrospira sp.]|nr:hypothetical protein [Nitrospira sp.]
MNLQVKLNTKGLLDYAKEGKQAVQKIRKAMRVSVNVARTRARREITGQFAVRTGGLKRAARKMQTQVWVKKSEVLGWVSPLPRLLNIFEGGATLANGRGFIQPRPVIGPSSVDMQRSAEKELSAVLAEVGK